MRYARLRCLRLLHLALAAAALALAVYASLAAGRCVGRHVYYIAPMVSGARYDFTAADIRALEEAAAPRRLSYVSLGSGLASRGEYRVYTRLVYTSGSYFDLNNMRFASGGAWADEFGQALVLNASLAWQLFGSLDAVGKTVAISGAYYTVAGIIEQDVLSKDAGCAYLPLRLDEAGATVSSLLFQPMEARPLDTEAALTSWLQQAGRDSRDYYLTNLDRYVEQVGLKARLLAIFSCGVLACAILCDSYRLARQSLRQPRTKAAYVSAALLLLLDLALLVALFRGLSFDFWIPHGGDSRWQDIFRAVANYQALPATQYLQENIAALARHNSQANAALLLGAVALLHLALIPIPARQPEAAPGEQTKKDAASFPAEEK